MLSRRAAVAAATRRLAAAGVADPPGDARRLCRWAAGLTGAGLAAGIDEMPAAQESVRFEAAIAARARRVPVAQITGLREFLGRRFRVTPDVLDPRPETETLVMAALERPAARVLDLGTGSGCILLSLLADWPDAEGTGTDASPAALAVARENAASLGLAGRARFVEADWCAGLSGAFDLVVSNPPYIAEAEIADLAPEPRLHEPRMALTPGGDGLGACRAIAAGLARLLAPGARVLIETGPGQTGAVAALLAAAGLEPEGVRCDLDGRGRVVTARVPAGNPGR